MSHRRELIRVARPDDDDRVWPLAQDLATSFTARRAAFDTTWQELSVAPGTLLLVAETTQLRIVGYLLATSHPTFFANGRLARVDELLVDHDHRRTGVGRRLMARAELWARSIGATQMELATRRAGEFYRTLGYRDSAVHFTKPLT